MMRRRFRFSLKFLLLVLAGSCVFVAWLANRIPHCRAIEQLESIDVEITWMRDDPSWLDQKLGAWRLDRVKRINIYGSSQTDFSMIEDLNYLEDFSTVECDHIDYQPLLQHSDTIRSLHLDPFPENPEAFFSHFLKLEHLSIREDIDLSRLHHLKNLRSIYTYYWPKIKAKQLAAFKNLQHLDLSGSNIQSTVPLAGLKHLESIVLDSCEELRDISGIEQLPRLNYLSLDDCPQLTDISPIAECKNLERLYLPPAGKPELVFAHLKKLTELDPLLSYLKPEDLELLANFPDLERISIDWSKMKSFDGVHLDLDRISHLKKLHYLCACRITDSDDLSNFTNLKNLLIRESEIKNADSIMALPHLEMVILSNCTFSDQVLKKLQTKSLRYGLHIYPLPQAKE